MTLKVRNRLITAFLIFSIISLITIISLLISNIANGTFKTVFGYDFFSLEQLSFIKPGQKTVLLSLIFIQFFVPVTACVLYFNFEKTQSSLIILFCAFLLGTQMELSKLYIALFNLQDTYSEIYLLLGNFSLMGKLISLFSFFLIASECKNTQKLDVEIDLIIILTISIFVTVCIPLNTSKCTNTFELTYGFSKTVIVLFITVVILTILTFIFSYHETENKKILHLMICYIFIMLGDYILTSSNIAVYVLAGSLCLIAGTNRFMKTLHRMYLWD